MKRIFQGILLIAFIVCNSIRVSAADSICRFFGGTAVTAVPGKTLEFPVYVSGQPEIAGFRVYVLADSSIFSGVPAESGGCQVTEGASLKGKGVLNASTYGQEGWQVLWYSQTNATPNGNLFTLPLRVSEDAVPGEYPVRILYSAADTINEEGGHVAFSITDGTIKVVSTKPMLYSLPIKAVQGQELDIPVYIASNPGMTAIMLTLEDTSQLKVVTGRDGKPIIQAGPLLRGDILCNTLPDGTGGQAMWYSTTPLAGDGILMTFRVRVTAPSGAVIQPAIQYDEKNTLNTDREKQELALDFGAISVQALDVEIVSAEQTADENCSIKLALSMEYGALQDSMILYVAAYQADGRMIAISSAPEKTVENQVIFNIRTDGSADKVTYFALEKDSFCPVIPAGSFYLNP